MILPDRWRFITGATASTVYPAHPVLIVEISDTSLAFDRWEKGSLYARAAIADYWIVNLADLAVEVYRNPEPDAGAAHDWRYGSVTTLRMGDVVSPRSAPNARIPIAELLP
jgi:Uma2 family endonuclease